MSLQIMIFILVILLNDVSATAPNVTIFTTGRVVLWNIQLNCQLSSCSESNIVWHKNNNVFNCTKHKQCILNSGCKGGHYWSNLTKTYPAIDDKYICIGSHNNRSSTDSFTIPCYDAKCVQESPNSADEEIRIKRGQSTSIKCHFVAQTKHIRHCFKFGVRHGNTTYVVNNVTVKKQAPKHKKDPTYVINYVYNIFNASKNSSGVYSCYYNFTTAVDHNQCHHEPFKKFRLIITDEPWPKRKQHNIFIAIVVSVGSMLIGLALLVLFIFWLRQKKVKSQRLYESEPELRWDVFVSYSSKDFVWVKELCKTLEQPPFNLTVCLHQRDWEVGRTILDNMADSVYCSHKTLLIVSKSYVESPFCMQELNIAMNCEVGNKVLKDRIILIKLDDVSLKNLPKNLKQKSYLDFSNSEQRKHYKSKLLKALPTRDSVQEFDNDEVTLNKLQINK